MRSRSAILFATLAALTLFLFLLDLAVGAVAVPLGDVWAALTGGDCPRATAKIILNIRLIKAVVALLAGAALSVSGLQMQTLRLREFLRASRISTLMQRSPRICADSFCLSS